jgi:hypothetical protein
MEFIHILIAMSKVIKTHCFNLLTDLDRGPILGFILVWYAFNSCGICASHIF